VVAARGAQRAQRVELLLVPIFHAIVLGLVQGLSEFLPISSSGHLILVPWLFNWHDFDNVSIEKAFDVALHLGTLFAVIAYFGRELWVYVREGVRLVVKREKPSSPEGRLAWLLVLSAVPAGAVGAVAEKTIDNKLGKPVLIGVSLIVFGLLLWWADRLKGERKLEEYTTGDAVKVGAAQVLALNPGTSRSGITITAARWLGFDRDSAARASFLMAIPVTAAISGYAAVWGTLKLVRTHSFAPFVVYRVAAGVLVLSVWFVRR
jgi:undecaprenyl-diphosphatase